MASPSEASASGIKRPRGVPGMGFDRAFRHASFAAALLVLILLAGIMIAMLIGGWPAFREMGLDFLTTSVWDTQNDKYGALSAIVGTLTTAVIALLIGLPLSLGIAVYLTQLAPPWFKQPVSTTIELLDMAMAAISPIINIRPRIAAIINITRFLSGPSSAKSDSSSLPGCALVAASTALDV